MTPVTVHTALAPIQSALTQAKDLLLARRDDEAKDILASASRSASAGLVVLRQQPGQDLRAQIARSALSGLMRQILRVQHILSLATPYRFHARRPPKAGEQLRIPLLALGTGTVPVGSSFDTIGPAVQTITLQSPQLPWLRYRLDALLIQRSIENAALLDNIVAEDLRWDGGYNLLLSQISADTLRAGNTQWIGFRDLPILEEVETLTLRLRGFSAGNAAPAGRSVMAAMAVITILDDLPAQHMLPTGGLPISYGAAGYSDAGPAPQELLRVAMEVATADALNAVGATGIRLSGAVPTVQLRAPLLPFTTYRIVGLEVTAPIRTVGTDVVTVEQLRLDGGMDLLAEAEGVPIEAFLGDEADRGGGSAQLAGLRRNPLVGPSDLVIATVSGFDGLTGAAGTVGNILLNGVNLLVDVGVPAGLPFDAVPQGTLLEGVDLPALPLFNPSLLPPPR